MDFVDSATGTEHRGHGATVRGEQEAETGIARMQNDAAPMGTAPNTINTESGVANTTASGPERTFGTKGEAVNQPGSGTGY